MGAGAWTLQRSGEAGKDCGVPSPQPAGCVLMAWKVDRDGVASEANPRRPPPSPPVVPPTLAERMLPDSSVWLVLVAMAVILAFFVITTPEVPPAPSSIPKGPAAQGVPKGR